MLLSYSPKNATVIGSTSTLEANVKDLLFRLKSKKFDYIPDQVSIL